jgi:hypothetical protein
MSTLEAQKPLKYYRIALQSALAAVFCLGLPAGLLLWLILFQKISHSVFVQPLIDFLHANGLYSIYILVVSSLIWSYLLGRISGYRPWWRIGLPRWASWRHGFRHWQTSTGFCMNIANLPIHLNYAASWLVDQQRDPLCRTSMGFFRSKKAALHLD